MRFYSVVLFTSSALLACSGSVLTASGINLRTVDHTSEFDQDGIAINRLLRTNDTMGEKEEERVSLSEVSKVADSTLTHATSPLRTSIGAVSKFTENNKDFQRVFRSENTNTEKNLAYIKEGLKDPELDKLIKSYSTKQDLVDDLIHKYQHEDLALALYEVKASEKSTENPATALYNAYFERLMANKETPLSMLNSWNNGKPLRKIFFRTHMIKVLGDFVEYYNKNSQTQTTLLQTLRNAFEHDYELASVLARAKREGDKTAEILQAELVQGYINDGLTLEEVLKTPRLTETDYHFSWDFDTLYEFAKLSRTKKKMLQTLRTGFGGDDKLAPALAGARTTDLTAKALLIQLVESYKGKSLEDVLSILKLRNKHKLTKNDLKTLKYFVLFSSPDTETLKEWMVQIEKLQKYKQTKQSPPGIKERPRGTSRHPEEETSES